MPTPAPAQTSTPLLQARHISVGWQEGPDVARDISLEISAGELVCLLGRSGCGKSTLLHALSGLTTPRQGTILVHGAPLQGPGQVGYMLQKDLLLPNKRLIDNVCLPLTLSGVPRAKARHQAQVLMSQAGLAGLELRWPSELSGGQRQRAALLRTRLTGSDIVLLDEPFSALDALTRVELRSWFCTMAHELGWACLLITHDVDEAVAIGARVLVLGAAAGEPSRIVGEVIPHKSATASNATSQSFDLTPEFLDAKAQVLALLQETV